MPEKKHNFTATEIKAGIMVLLSAAVFIGFIAVVQGMRPPQEVKSYFALFSNITGLNLGADVRFGGVKVGRVLDIVPAPGDQTQIQVTAAVAPTTPVNTETVASIEQITLTAEKHLELSTGTPEAAALPGGATVKSITKSGGLVELPDMGGVITKVEDLLDDLTDFLGVEEAKELEEKGEEEFAKVTRITADLRKTMDEGNALVKDVRDVLEEQRPNINDITGKVKEIEDSVKQVLDDVQGMLEENREAIHGTLDNAQEASESVTKVTKKVQELLDSMGGDIETLLDSLQQTMNNADGLSGNARDFLEDNRPAIEDIVLDLRESLRYVKDFSRTLAEQPESVIRGKTPSGRVD